MIFLPESHRGARRSRILLGALLSMVLSACSAGIDASIRSDLSATVAIGAEVPEALAAKLAQLRGAAPGGGAVAPLFDPAQARSGASERGLAVLEASAPTQRSFRGVFAVADLATAAKGSGGIVSLVRSGGIVALTVRLDRSNAKSLPALFPGVDPYIIEALAPPAFDEAPLTRAEYRETLGAILGTKSLPAIDAAGVDLSLTLPAIPFAVSGAAVEGRIVRARLPLLDILMLERPIQISVSWRE